MKTDRTKYIDTEVLQSAPIGGHVKDIKFFKTGTYITNNQLEKEYLNRNLMPCTIDVLLEYDATHRENLDEMKYVGTQWKDTDGKWCFATFIRWSVERSVDVDRSGGDWNDDWWFAGLRKSDLKTSDTKNSLDTLSLESAIELIKKEGYVIYKPI